MAADVREARRAAEEVAAHVRTVQALARGIAAALPSWMALARAEVGLAWHHMIWLACGEEM
jgi:hypothetical protein